MTNWHITPGEKAAERANRLDVDNTGDIHLSLSHFLNRLAASEEPVISQRLQSQLLFRVLCETPLRHFTKLNKNPFLTPVFLKGITALKTERIGCDFLESVLERTGSLKEYDLLRVYQNYEAEKKRMGISDGQDRFPAAELNLRANEDLKEVDSITLWHFDRIGSGLRQLLEVIPKHFPNIEVTFENLPDPDPEKWGNASCFSLPSPHQEVYWFCENWSLHGERPSRTAILMGSNPRYYETIWEKLKPLGLTRGISPFLKWRERPEGRAALKAVRQLPKETRPPIGFLEALLEKTKDEALFERLQRYRFSLNRLSFENWSREEFLKWCEWILEERPARSIPESLEGLQWLDPNEGDFPDVDCLWVPGLTMEQFQLPRPPDFFQDPIDRSRPEWAPLVQAFEEPKIVFARQRKTFRRFLSQVDQGAWLTLPRGNSQGGELTPSPLTWDFEWNSLPPIAPPLYREQARHEQLLRVESERQQDRLETAPFHADLSECDLDYEVRNRDHFFSASQLEDYAACPFKYYARRVLNVPQKKDFSPEVDANDKGTLFHAVFEKLFREEVELYSEARKNPKKESLLLEKLKEINEAVFAEKKKKYDYANRALYLRLKEKTLAQAKAILSRELEEARNLSGALTPKFFEHKFEWTLGNIRLKGVIDRIDVDESRKRFLVLDYKTGDTKSMKSDLADGLALQLPIYMHAARQTLLPDYSPIGGLLVSVRTGERKHGLVDKTENGNVFQIHGRTGSLMEPETLRETTDQALAAATGYVTEIRAGHFSAQPKDCQPSCDYREICRYAFKKKD